MIASFARVGDLAEQIRGVTYGKEDASKTPTPGYLPVLRAGNITDFGLVFDDLVYVPEAKVAAKQKVRKGDIVIAASSGSLDVVGKAAPALAAFDGGFGAFCKVIRPTSKVDAAYLAQFFKTPSYRRTISGLAAGANINNLKSEHLDDLQVLLPPLPEQRRIAAILDQADALRAKRREALAQLDSLTQSIFIEMFGDPGNPKRWSLETLPVAADFQEGPGIMAKDFRQAGVPLVRLAGINGTDVSLRGCNFVEPDMFARKWAHFALNEGDILVLTSATFGNPAVVGKEAAGAIFYTGIIRFKPKHSGVDAVYLRHFLASTWFMRQATSLASGAVIKHFGPTHLKQMSIPVPPFHLQRQFSQRAAQVELMRRPFVQAADESERLFASLQHRAFACQL